MLIVSYNIRGVEGPSKFQVFIYKENYRWKKQAHNNNNNFESQTLILKLSQGAYSDPKAQYVVTKLGICDVPINGLLTFDGLIVFIILPSDSNPLVVRILGGEQDVGLPNDNEGWSC